MINKKIIDTIVKFVYVTPKGYYYKILFDGKKKRIGMKKFQFFKKTNKQISNSFFRTVANVKTLNNLKVSRCLEKFFTNPDIAKLCVSLWQKNLNILKTDTIVEPSAGNGSFSNLLKNYYKNFIAYDIQPECSKIIKQDFLSLNLTQFKKPIHFIGNPPFGKQASLAIKFFNHAS